MQLVTKFAMAALGAGVAYGLYRRRKRRDIRGQTVLVTGSSRGLGFLLAREYARQGCQIVICARNEEELDVARDRLRQEEGADVLAVPCDISEERQVRVLVEEATRHFGGIDILVNNGGTIQVGPIEETKIEDFEEAMGTMFYGVLMPTLAVMPQMIERRAGRIVNITSFGGKVGVPHLIPYSAAKFAAMGLSQGLHAELARHDISVTTIVPGLMRTGSYVHALFKGRRSDEFTWFSLASSLPLMTMNAERAASQIVTASRKRKAEHMVGVSARFVTAFSGLFPGLSARFLGVFNSVVLPRADGDQPAMIPGRKVKPQLGAVFSRIIEVGTTLGRRAGQRYNQALDVD